MFLGTKINTSGQIGWHTITVFAVKVFTPELVELSINKENKHIVYQKINQLPQFQRGW